MSELHLDSVTLARGMLNEGIITFTPSSLKDRESLGYVDLRQMISLPGLFTLAVHSYSRSLQDSDLFKISDTRKRFLVPIPEAVTLYAGAVSMKMNVPLLYPRVKMKKHGNPKAIEGRYEEGNEVVFIDDVVTSSNSKKQEVAKFSLNGLKTVGITVLVDRQQGGKTELERLGIPLVSAMTLSGIAKYALDENLAGVTQTVYEDLLGELDPSEL